MRQQLSTNYFFKTSYQIISRQFQLPFQFISAHLGISLQNIISKATNLINTKQNIKHPDYSNYTNHDTVKSTSFKAKPIKSKVPLVAEANGLIHLHPTV